MPAVLRAMRDLSIPLPNGSRISVPLTLPFAVIHVLALGVFFVKFRWAYLITCLALVAIRMRINGIPVRSDTWCRKSKGIIYR